MTYLVTEMKAFLTAVDVKDPLSLLRNRISCSPLMTTSSLSIVPSVTNIH